MGELPAARPRALRFEGAALLIADGRLTLVAVADNGADDGVGRRPNPVACFFLTSP
jgi:hypothetical protein